MARFSDSMCFTKKVKAYLDFLYKFYFIYIYFLFWKHLVSFSTIRAHKSVYTTDNTIFIEFSRNTEVVFISCRRINGRKLKAKPTFNSQKFVVTHTFLQTEISELLDS